MKRGGSMGRQKKRTEDEVLMRPGSTPEARENQLIALATNLAEKQLRDGTAKSQVIVHYLKLATTRERIEKERQKELLEAKTKALEAAKRQDELYAKALSAMRLYSGQGDPDEDF